MEEKLSLVITLPESLAGLPIRFEVNSGCRNIALNLESSTPIKKKVSADMEPDRLFESG